MSPALEFVEANPQTAAARLDASDIHLWRIPYTLSQRRAPLLALLSAYLEVPAAEIALAQDARGKPQLDRSMRARERVPRLEFNWSHSGNYALIALAFESALGVDIEQFGANPRALEIARRFFDSAEAETLAKLDQSVRDRAFIGLWCAKEAVLKAAGEGLSFGLARLVFQRRDGDEWTLMGTDPALGSPDDWQLLNFEAASGYRGALAWRGASRKIVPLRPAEAGATCCMPPDTGTG